MNKKLNQIQIVNRFNILRLILLIFLIVFLFSCKNKTKHDIAPTFDPTGYFVAWHSNLDHVSEGVQGSVELMLDSGFKDLKKPDFSIYHCDASDEYSDFKFAYLVLKNESGKYQDFIELNDPAIKPLKVTSFIPGNKPVYFMQRYFDSGNPDMCGVYNDLYVVKNGKIEELEAIDRKSGSKFKVSVGNGMRTAFTMVDSEKGKELLYVHCLVSKNYIKTTYYRYYYEADKLFVEINTDKDIWDSEMMKFPGINKFRKF